MSKKTLEITFKYGAEQVALSWKGFKYDKHSFIDFFNRFLDFFPWNLEVVDRDKDITQAV